ncbi:hypothetical protein FQA39_LY08042 [Lamprigera yunnana]|nr:hypothetical protein FQA39_LY08042 [Lamprigera yunnana]
MDEEVENHANSEGDELVAAAEEVEILSNDADAEVDVVRDKEINIDPEEDETVEKEIIDEEILDKVASVICLATSIHREANSAHEKRCTHKAGRKRLPSKTLRDEKEKATPSSTDPSHHSTDTKADALRMSDVENGKVRERTRSPPGLISRVTGIGKLCAYFRAKVMRKTDQLKANFINFNIMQPNEYVEELNSEKIEKKYGWFMPSCRHENGCRQSDAFGKGAK